MPSESNPSAIPNSCPDCARLRAALTVIAGDDLAAESGGVKLKHCRLCHLVWVADGPPLHMSGCVAGIARAALAAPAAPDPRREAARRDTRLLDWWEAHLNYEHSTDYDTGEVVIYRVTGNINDREWHEAARANTLRDALAALDAKGEQG